jgi:hypothetical protein
MCFACSQARVAAFSFAQSGIALESFEKPVSLETGFFVFKRFGAVTAFVSPPFLFGVSNNIIFLYSLWARIANPRYR